MPYRIPACAGKPYTPSNGTEGMRFEEEFCHHCIREDADGAGCMIFAAAFFGDQPPEWTHDAEGCPTCTAFKPLTFDEERRREARS